LHSACTADEAAPTPTPPLVKPRSGTPAARRTAIASSADIADRSARVTSTDDDDDDDVFPRPSIHTTSSRRLSSRPGSASSPRVDAA